MAQQIPPSARCRFRWALALGVIWIGVFALYAVPLASAQEGFPLPPGMDLWEGDPDALQPWDLEKSPPPLVPRAKRHREYLQAGVPLEYRAHRSPFPAAGAVILDGGRLYAQHCAKCHGSAGLGGGDAGLDLTPSPALLARLMDVQGAVDEYLLWSIAEGGGAFGTDMPAFKNKLSETEIWQIVAYMRAGFPAADGWKPAVD